MMEQWNYGTMGYGGMVKWVNSEIHIDKEFHDVYK
jgi:hypothetical protein